MKILISLLLLIVIASCGKEEPTRQEEKAFKSLRVETCLARYMMCEVRIGKLRYCRDTNWRSAVHIDCEIYDEAKRLMREIKNIDMDKK